MGRRRIAILGGGLAGLAAAWELTSRRRWQDDYEVTIYQLGWRCGGKMRGGRGPHGRVQELGLHLLLGFYEHAWPLFAAAWNQRQALHLAPRCPHATFDDVIQPNNAILLVHYDREAGRWRNWPLVLPTTPGTPGDGRPPNVWQQLKKGIAILLELVLGSPYAPHLDPVARWLLDHFFPPDGGDPHPPAPAAAPAPPEGLPAPLRAAISQARRLALDHLLEAVETVLGAAMQEAHADRERNDEAGLLHQALDFGLALLRGILADCYDPEDGRFDFRRVDDRDLRAWLAGHGACEPTLRGPLVDFFYKATFEALADGDQQGGLLAAGSACRFLLPALAYKGSFINQLKLGTADTLVAPLYQVLAARGVRFRFFHRVERLRCAPDARRIEAIEVAIQAEVRGGREYDPLIEVRGVPCWPDRPRYEQLVHEQAVRLEAGGIDLESPWSGWTPVDRRVLRRGADFDEVLLAIPAPALRGICEELAARSPAWADMLAGIASAPVMSCQLWFDRDLRELGFDPHAWGVGDVDCAANVVTYANPLFSWLDQSQILASEGWKDPAPRALAMFTGTLPASGEPPPPPGKSDHLERERARARALTWQWLMDHMGWFLPDATPPAYPQGLDLSVLHPLDPRHASGPERFRDQFFTVAVAPSDRYVIAPPQPRNIRLHPGRSGFHNLFLAGDWTDYGANIGFMEGCVQSARQAVAALLAHMGIPHAGPEPDPYLKT